MLEVRGLRSRIRRGRGAARRRHVDRPQGEIVALLGSNGVGKTTFASTVSGLDCAARAGRSVFKGEEITGLSPQAIVDAGLIQVPEGRHVFPNLTVRENLELGAYRRARPNASHEHGTGAGNLSAPARTDLPRRPARSPAASSRCWRSAAA